LPEADDLALLTGASREAGQIALRYWRNDPEHWEKPGEQGPVSEADLAVNAALSARLRTARPGYGWLSGTRAFLAREECFAISLAVVRDHQPVVGVVFLPALDRLYAASVDGPATCNGTGITCSNRDKLTGADVLTTRASLDPAQWPGGVPGITRSFRASLAYRLCLAAEGRHDAMLTLRDAWEWDIAAGALIAMRAGCVVTDRLGHPLRFNAPHPRAQGTIAANPALSAQFLQALGN
jgi:myo-inositol-1(or 4)-monophosphatase